MKDYLYYNKVDLLGLTSQNFIKKIKSKRIISKRLKIHNKINIIKKKFMLKKQKYLENLVNDIDVISRENIINIPISDILILNVDNKKIAFSSSNLIKWLIRFESDIIPTNPYTNEKMNIFDRVKCYKIYYEYYQKCKKSNKYLINKMNFDHLKEMKKILCKFQILENYRQNPQKIIDLYNTKIGDYSEKIILKLRPILGNNINHVCINCLINIEQCEYITSTNISLEEMYDIKRLALLIYDFKYKINEINDKIINNYFI